MLVRRTRPNAKKLLTIIRLEPQKTTPSVDPCDEQRAARSATSATGIPQGSDRAEGVQRALAVGVKGQEVEAELHTLGRQQFAPKDQ